MARGSRPARRRPPCPWPAVAGLILLAGLGVARPASASELTPQEERGKQIYFEGTSARGTEILAYIGEDLTELPGSAADCASCHGPDGRGRPEAGVIPSDVTWDYLMKPYGHAHPMDRKHGAFDRDSLAASIVQGHDPAGNPLDPSMPIYLMSDEDLDDLIAYMRRLETDLDPGLSGDSIRLGSVLPTRGQMAVIGQAIVEVLAAYLDEINDQGGINNRRLELVESPYDNSQESPLAAAEGLVEEGDVFALLSPVVAGADREIGRLAEDEKLPVIGPFTLFSPDPYAINDYTFYLFSGLREQARALVDFAADRLGLESPAIALVAPDDEAYRGVAQAVEAQCRKHGWAAADEVAFLPATTAAGDTAARLAEADVEVLFALGWENLGAVLAAADELELRPYVFLPGAFVRPQIFELPAGFQERIYLSYPTLAADSSRSAMGELEALLARHDFAVRHRPSQVFAYVSARLLVEGLKNAGRDLSRTKLLRALEKLYDYHTGLTPPITYGANRRIGALGAYVVAVDLENQTFTPVGGWLTPR